MTPFEEMISSPALRDSMFRSLGCIETGSAEECAASFAVAWPEMAELWPEGTPGREVISFALMDGPGERAFCGIEYPPLLPAVRWCLIALGFEALYMRSIEGGEKGVRASVSLSDFRGDERVDLSEVENTMRSRIGNGFFDLPILNSDLIPWTPQSWRSSFRLSWHLPTDRVETTLSLWPQKGRDEMSRFKVSTRSEEHLKKLLGLVSSVTGGAHAY